MHPSQDIFIDATTAGQTLAAALRQNFPKLSWAEARRLVASRRVRINATVSLDDARRMKTGDVVEVRAEGNAGPPAEAAVRILFSDADLAVVEKPAGIQTVRRIEERNWSEERKRRQPVLDEVTQRMLSRPGPKALSVRPVHRLDRNTSGLMLFALSSRAEPELIRRFARHDIARTYQAVVHGRLQAPLTIATMLHRDRGDGLRGTRPGSAPAESQRTITHLRPIAAISNMYSLIECRLETGRTHQIRIHLAEIGHMLCGEKVYTRPGPRAPEVLDESGAPRQALHSAELRFDHPISGKQMRFESDWPPDMARWLAGLRGVNS